VLLLLVLLLLFVLLLLLLLLLFYTPGSIDHWGYYYNYHAVLNTPYVYHKDDGIADLCYRRSIGADVFAEHQSAGKLGVRVGLD